MKLLQFIGLNKIRLAVYFMLASLFITGGYLLKESYQRNGEIAEQLQSSKRANLAWLDAWKTRETEIKAAQARMTKRDADYKEIEGQLNEYKAKLREIIGDSSDCGVRPDVWMLIEDSAASGSLPRH